ncbi:MAG: hypothetical protein H7X88_01355 [Gloeobacteraceae cyanobacterium ES-bin-316]|nr:hypothetical protein [Ferruginibacter sp.]
MRYSKISKTGEYALAAQLITMNELNAMSAFIKNFKLKYESKKTKTARKKK